MSQKTPAELLAEKALAVLAKQREFFDKGRNPDVLRACKQLEKELRTMANEILHPEHVQQHLFNPQE